MHSRRRRWVHTLFVNKYVTRAKLYTCSLAFSDSLIQHGVVVPVDKRRTVMTQGSQRQKPHKEDEEARDSCEARCWYEHQIPKTVVGHWPEHCAGGNAAAAEGVLTVRLAMSVGLNDAGWRRNAALTRYANLPALLSLQGNWMKSSCDFVMISDPCAPSNKIYKRCRKPSVILLAASLCTGERNVPRKDCKVLYRCCPQENNRSLTEHAHSAYERDFQTSLIHYYYSLTTKLGGNAAGTTCNILGTGASARRQCR